MYGSVRGAVSNGRPYRDRSSHQAMAADLNPAEVRPCEAARQKRATLGMVGRNRHGSQRGKFYGSGGASCIGRG